MRRLLFIIVLFISICILYTGCGNKAEVNINGVEDLKGLTIGCQAGTTGEIYIRDNIENAKLKSFKSGIDAAISLKNRAIDAIILDELPAKSIVANNSDLAIVDDEFSSEDYAIAVKKGNTKLLNSINDTINNIMNDGTYNVLTDAFMSSTGKITIPNSIASDSIIPIKLGLNASFKPFEYVEGSKIVGFDISLGEYIARDLGCKLQVVDMSFDSLIAALQSGAIDFIASGMTATDERRANVDFSIPYYRSNQVIIIRKAK